MLCKEKSWSYVNFPDQINTSNEIISEFESKEYLPSILKMANGVGITVNFTLSENEVTNLFKDLKTSQRFQYISVLPDREKESLFINVDHYIRATKISLQ